MWSFLESAHRYPTRDFHRLAMDEWGDRPARVRAREEFHMMGPTAAKYEEAEEQLPAGEPLNHDVI